MLGKWSLNKVREENVERKYFHLSMSMCFCINFRFSAVLFNSRKKTNSSSNESFTLDK